jgi:aminopeptidase N
MFCFASRVQADRYPRNRQINVLHYVFRLSLQDESNEIIGQTSIDIQFCEAGVDRFELDLTGKERGDAKTGMTVSRVTVDNSELRFEHQNNRLKIDLDEKVVGKIEKGQSLRINIDYLGTPQEGLVIRDNKYHERTFFADNFPNRARQWLPVLDHPYDKATCEFIVTAPKPYRVVANGKLIEELDNVSTHQTHWKQSVPISTYLMVIGAARFATQDVEPVAGIPIQTWVFPEDQDVGFAVFGEAGKPLKFFIDRIGPYPYEKLANVQSTNRYGATEFASSIFYGEDVFSRGSGFPIMVHEIAHQWFGDSITTNDWNHVWLSEGFATYLTHLYFEAESGREQLVEGMQKDRERVIRSAASHPDQPLIDERLPVERTLTGDAYQKGAWVLHMLRHRIGDEHFWNGLREYYQRYHESNCNSEDFQKVMQEVSGIDLSEFFEQWLYAPEFPKFAGSWRYDTATKQVVINLEQTQKFHKFKVPLEIGLFYDGRPAPIVKQIQVSSARDVFRIPSDAVPSRIELDPDTWLLMESKFETKPVSVAD